MIDVNEARQVLTDNQQIKAFDDIVFQRVLGASRHINMIGEMIESIALDGKKNKLPTEKVVDHVQTLAQYFIETRGSASQAISNAIDIMIKNIDEARDLNIIEASKAIIQKKDDYLLGAVEATNTVVGYGVKSRIKNEKDYGF